MSFWRALLAKVIGSSFRLIDGEPARRPSAVRPAGSIASASA